ncbi:MAG: aldehyde dehydrogenase family protein, partial [Gemmatimonadota bacterium]
MAHTAPLQNHVRGAFVDATVGDGIEDFNPSDASDIIGMVPRGSRADVQTAVDAAAEALPRWRAITGPARADHLYRWAEVIAARRDELALALTREVGKPIGESRGEIGRCIVILR